MSESEERCIIVALPGGPLQEEWARFAEELTGRWPGPVKVKPGRPPTAWRGLVLSEAAVLLPLLRGLPPEAAEDLAARSVVRVSSEESALRIFSERLFLAAISGGAWYRWIYPGGEPAELYGYRDLAEPLPVVLRPLQGLPSYCQMVSEGQSLPDLLADYLRAALQIEG